MPANIDEQTFEKSFAEMALANLKGKAPALIDYMMGFQLVERNDEDTRAVGFFGFKIGAHWVYTPVFFLSGEIKGTELMYVKGQDIFLPLEEGWVNYLIQKKPFTLGEPSSRARRSEDGISAPDLRVLTRPPQGSKLSSDMVSMVAQSMSSTNLQPWAKEAADVLNGALDSMAKHGFTSGQQDMSLPAVLGRTGNLTPFLAQMQTNPKLASAVLKMYTPAELVEGATKAAMAKYQKTPSYKSAAARPMIMDRDDALKDHGAQHILTNDEKKQVMRGNTVIRDNRPEVEKTKVYDTEVEKSLENAQEAGLYDMLTIDGGFAKVLLLVPRPVGSGSSQGTRMIVDPKTNTYRYAPVTGIWTAHKYTREEYLKVLGGMGTSCSDPSYGKSADEDLSQETCVSDEDSYLTRYTVISPGGEVLFPFCVERAFNNVDGQKTLQVESDIPSIANNDVVGNGARSYRPAFSEFPFENALAVKDDGSIDIKADGTNQYSSAIKAPQRYGCYGRIILTDKPLRSLVRSGDTVMVPRDEEKGCRWVKLREAQAECDPGTTADLYMQIGKFAEQLTVRDDGLVKTFHHEGKMASAHNEKQALQHLICDLGVGVIEARTILKQAADNRRSNQKFLFRRPKTPVVKEAAPFDELINRNLSFDPGINAPLQESQEELFTDVPEYQSNRDDDAYKHYVGENSTDYRGIYEKDIDTMQQAAATGQRDVFDSSAIGSLINVDNINDEIDGYMSDMIQAIDKLGRTLFITYWHHEEVEDRYGKPALRTLEDDLKSVFQKLGDVVLELKKKSPTDSDAFGRGLLEGIS